MDLSTGNIPTEKIKGRGIIRINQRYFADVFHDLDISKTDTQGLLHDTGVLAAIHGRLLLPTSYNVLGLYFEFLRGTWALVVESHDLEAAEPNKQLPILEPVYEHDYGNDTTSLVRITVHPW